MIKEDWLGIEIGLLIVYIRISLLAIPKKNSITLLGLEIYDKEEKYKSFEGENP